MGASNLDDKFSLVKIQDNPDLEIEDSVELIIDGAKGASDLVAAFEIGDAAAAGEWQKPDGTVVAGCRPINASFAFEKQDILFDPTANL